MELLYCNNKNVFDVDKEKLDIFEELKTQFKVLGQANLFVCYLETQLIRRDANGLLNRHTFT